MNQIVGRGMPMEDSANAKPGAVDVRTVRPRTTPCNAPELFASRMAGHDKRASGDPFGRQNFGVNLPRLHPSGESALLHRHSQQDEFTDVLGRRPTLVIDQDEIELAPGMCTGHRAGGAPFLIVNRTTADVVCLEVGDRSEGDQGSYPSNDLAATLGPDGR